MNPEPQRGEPPPEDWDAHWSAYDDAAHMNPANRYRRKLIFATLRTAPPDRPLRVLDLGCGQGHVLRAVRAAFPRAELAGLDFSETALELSRARVPDGRFARADFSKPLALPPDLTGWATHIVCSEVLEHLDDPALLLSEVRAAMEATGQIIVTVPGGPRTAFDRYIGHRRHYTPASLRALFDASGYGSHDVVGAGFPFFNLYKLTVLARGRGLIDAVKSSDAARLSKTAMLAMKAFDKLFQHNRDRSLRGWQILGVAQR